MRRHSAEYKEVLARAAYWVDNQTFPNSVVKSPDQRYLQTWHGIPLKLMGRHAPGGWKAPADRSRGVGAWDLLCAPNEYFVRTLADAFLFTGELVRYGTPRNDCLVDGSMDQAKARRLLGLPLTRLVVLYAPTFRGDAALRPEHISLPFNPQVFLDAPGLRDALILTRTHYLDRLDPSTARDAQVLDMSQVHDINLLYHAADLLVTDYSSVMFDFALLRRPILFLAHDLQEYQRTRGTYVDLRAIAPGPVVETVDELRAAAEDLDCYWSVYGERYERFLADYCGREDGRASERAVRALLEMES